MKIIENYLQSVLNCITVNSITCNLKVLKQKSVLKSWSNISWSRIIWMQWNKMIILDHCLYVTDKITENFLFLFTICYFFHLRTDSIWCNRLDRCTRSERHQWSFGRRSCADWHGTKCKDVHVWKILTALYCAFKNQLIHLKLSHLVYCFEFLTFYQIYTFKRNECKWQNYIFQYYIIIFIYLSVIRPRKKCSCKLLSYLFIIKME